MARIQGKKYTLTAIQPADIESKPTKLKNKGQKGKAANYEGKKNGSNKPNTARKLEFDHVKASKEVINDIITKLPAHIFQPNKPKSKEYLVNR